MKDLYKCSLDELLTEADCWDGDESYNALQ